MKHPAYPRALLMGTACALLLASGTWAADFNIPAGDLESALNAYTSTTGVDLIVATDAIKGVRTKGAMGSISPDAALSRLLSGTGFHAQRQPSGAIAIVAGQQSSAADIAPMQLAQAMPVARAVETVTVTSSKLGGADVQSIPISITALSQEQLTATQTNGGPDLIKQVPNMTFTKTNFSGYSIQLRGIGTQAISVTTDPAVAVSFNDIPFIRNHFFEQEFFDVGQVEVLRGPQGTLYGRNATAGVVNLTSARPTDQFEAMASGEIGNYHQRRFEGMVNIPITDDRLDVRVAGEWTKRQGYSFNQIENTRIDGRDLWSGRVTIGFKPMESLQTYLIWEHFSEDDDRLRSSKQLCKTDKPPATVNGVTIYPASLNLFGAISLSQNYLSQGCLPTSLYSSDAFQVPYGFSLPYANAVGVANMTANQDLDPYLNTVQSPNLRIIESTVDPVYKAKNDIVEFNADYDVSPTLTLTAQTGFNHDFLWSSEDYNRFNTSPGFFREASDPNDTFGRGTVVNGYFCDPQVGCANRLVAEDLVKQHSWQLSQEVRVSSHMSGPFNFTLGGNYLHYETAENYYVFINGLTLYSLTGSGTTSYPRPYVPGVSDNHECLQASGGGAGGGGWQFSQPGAVSTPSEVCIYVDPNSIENVNDQGHNYFLSKNPYVLNSYAAFGESNYQVTDDFKLTAGLRWTEDRKHFVLVPSQLILGGYGQAPTGDVNQSWDQFTGRFVA
ncbi:MAG TPA: TonB-dependent receptor plug domain-containing protein, partial [Rhizomicrobium sp.]|nr:TonB-dependent receptor plug domain-containing protein [Rhizomicrobium sp.]